MAFIPSDRFLLASDFIQAVDEPSQYASEVWKAVQCDGLHPERTAAEHLSLTPWSKIEELQKPRNLRPSIGVSQLWTRLKSALEFRRVEPSISSGAHAFPAKQPSVRS